MSDIHFHHFTKSWKEPYLVGNAGADHIYGEAGNDYLDGGDLPDFMDGGTGDDIIHGGNDADVLIGAEGNDKIFGDAFTDELHGNAGNDYLDGGLDADFIFAGSGDDIVVGGEGLDTTYGEWGDDRMFAGPGPDQLFGGYGDDILNAGSGGQNQNLNVDEALGEFGFNLVSFSDIDIPLNVAADLAYENINQAAVTPFGQLWVNIQGIEGSIYDDHILGYIGDKDEITHQLNGNVDPLLLNNWLIGGGGNDTIEGGAGNDVIVGDAINLVTLNSLLAPEDRHFLDLQVSAPDLNLGDKATITTNGLQYTAAVQGNDTMTGGDGNDIFIVNNAGDTVRELDGQGTDTVYSYVNYNITNTNFVENLTLMGDGNINGYGNQLDNILTGNSGSNTLNGNGGNDIIYGGGGADFLNGGGGADEIHGGDGDDTIHGDGGNDILYGEAGNDIIFGDSGSNTLYGGADNDILDGGIGADALFGDEGDDILKGGDAQDTLAGGLGADIFDFTGVNVRASRDTVTDFLTGTDKVRLSDSLTTRSGGGTPALQEITATGTGVTLNVGTYDIFEINSAITGLPGTANGAELIAGLGQIRTNGAGDQGYLVAYDNVDAYLYYFNSGTAGNANQNTIVAAGEIHLIGTFNNVTPGAFTATDFALV